MSNCLLYALGNWIRHGGYLAIRKSRHGFWMHFLWIKDLRDAEIYHYVPHERLKKPLLSKYFFKGKIKTGDSK